MWKSFRKLAQLPTATLSGALAVPIQPWSLPLYTSTSYGSAVDAALAWAVTPVNTATTGYGNITHLLEAACCYIIRLVLRTPKQHA